MLLRILSASLMALDCRCIGPPAEGVGWIEWLERRAVAEGAGDPGAVDIFDIVVGTLELELEAGGGGGDSALVSTYCSLSEMMAASPVPPLSSIAPIQ